MFEKIISFFKNVKKNQEKENSSKDTAKERLHLVLMQDRANVSADFLELMKQEIIEVIKKYVDVDEKEIDVRLTNKSNDDGTTGAPALYANIPILNVRNDMRKETMPEEKIEHNKIAETYQDQGEKQEEDIENNEEVMGNNEKEIEDINEEFLTHEEDTEEIIENSEEIEQTEEHQENVEDNIAENDEIHDEIHKEEIKNEGPKEEISQNIQNNQNINKQYNNYKKHKHKNRKG